LNYPRAYDLLENQDITIPIKAKRLTHKNISCFKINPEGNREVLEDLRPRLEFTKLSD